MKTQTIVAVLAVLMFMTAPVMAVTSWAEAGAIANEEGSVVNTAAGSYTDTMSVSAGSIAIGDDVFSSSGSTGIESELYSGTYAEGMITLGGASADVEMEDANVDLESDVLAGALDGSIEAASYATDAVNDQETAVIASAEGLAAGVEASGSASNWDGSASIDIGGAAVFGSVEVGESSTAPIDDANVGGEASASGIYVITGAYVSALADNEDDEATALSGSIASGDETETGASAIAGDMFASASSFGEAFGLGGAGSLTLAEASAHDA